MPGLHPTLRNACFERNLAALRMRQPDVSDALGEAMPPAEASLAIGRDGCPLVVLEGEGEAACWLGGSSAPSVSIPARFGAWEDKGGNVALPSIGSGYEALHLTSLLGAHRAVFVCEPDVGRVALALAAVDLSAVIETGRVILLAGDVGATAETFFRMNPGFLYPSQIVGMASGDAAALGDCKSALDGASRSVHAQFQQLVLTTLKGYRPKPIAEAVRRLLVISSDPVGGAPAFARELAAAASALNVDVDIVAAVQPDLGSAAPYLQRLVAFKPDLVLFLNGTAAAFGAHWPKDQPSIGWFLESDQLQASSLAGLGKAAGLFAASSMVVDLLVRHGARRDRIAVAERGVDATVYNPREDRPGDRGPAATQATAGLVVLMADVHDTRAEAAHIRLESHVRLWQVAGRLAADVFATGGSLEPEGLVERAEQETGVVIGDSALRTTMIALVETRLIPTVASRVSATALADPVIFGTGWGDEAGWQSSWSGPVPGDAARRDIYAGALVVVLPSLATSNAWWALEALASGRLPVLRWDAGGWHTSYPRAAGVLGSLPTFSSPSELKEIVARARDAGTRQGWIEPLRRRVLEDLTVQSSLARVIHEVVSHS